MCRRIDLQMRLCQRIKAGQTPDPGPAPPPARPSAPRGPGQAWHRESWARLCLCRRHAGELRGILRTKLPAEQGATALASRGPGRGCRIPQPLGAFYCPTSLLGRVFWDLLGRGLAGVGVRGLGEEFYAGEVLTTGWLATWTCHPVVFDALNL